MIISTLLIQFTWIFCVQMWSTRWVKGQSELECEDSEPTDEILNNRPKNHNSAGESKHCHFIEFQESVVQ